MYHKLQNLNKETTLGYLGAATFFLILLPIAPFLLGALLVYAAACGMVKLSELITPLGAVLLVVAISFVIENSM